MLFLNNAFTKDITEYDGEVLKEVKTVDGKIYLSNGAIIKEGVVGKFFDIATNDKYGTVFEADGPDEIGPIVGFAPVTGDSAPDYFAFCLSKLNKLRQSNTLFRFFLFRQLGYQLNKHKDRKSDNEKVESGLQEISVIQCYSGYFLTVHYFGRLHHPF